MSAPRLTHVRALDEWRDSRQNHARRARRGQEVRLARGAYVDGVEWAGLDAPDRYRLAIRAALEARHRSPLVASHWSAAALHGLPILGDWPSRIHVTIEPTTGGRSDPAMFKHSLRLSADDVVVKDGLLVTSVARTVVDIASVADPLTAVMLADRAVLIDRWGRHRAMATQGELFDAWDRALPFRSFKRARRILDFAVTSAESPLESVSRLNMFRIGTPPPILQQEFSDADGRIGFADFFWPTLQLVGEADGTGKYLDDRLLNGLSTKQAVVDEKRRDASHVNACRRHTCGGARKRRRVKGPQTVGLGWHSGRVGRLRRSDSSRAGLTRRRSGKGFSYHDLAGNLITDPELKARIEHLAIPPAWTDVWIAPYVNGHIQATGVDAAGRRQYIYHPTWREQKDRIKFDRALALAESLPTARRTVTMDLRSDGPTRERALAAGFRMLDTGSLRVGSERYAEQHGSFGLTTLLCAHATLSGDTVRLRFPAKSGEAWDSDITDPDLASVIRSLKRRGPTARLLAFRDARGWHPLDGAEINEYVRERTGGEFTAKDFRTLHGTIAAASSLARHGPEDRPTRRQRAVAQAMRDAAEVLGNTPAIARKSYVDPRIVDRYSHGHTIDPSRLGSAESDLRAMLFE